MWQATLLDAFAQRDANVGPWCELINQNSHWHSHATYLSQRVLELEEELQRRDEQVVQRERLVNDLRHELDEKSKHRQQLTDELVAAQLELSQMDDRLKRVERENQQLTERLVRRAREEVERVNLQNERRRRQPRSNRDGSDDDDEDLLIMPSSMEASLQSLEPRLPLKQSDHRLAASGITSINRVCAHPSRIVAFGCRDRSVRLWDANTQTTGQTLHDALNEVVELAFSSDAEQLVSASLDHALRVYSMGGGSSPRYALKHTLTGHVGRITHAQFSANHHHTLISSSLDRSAKLWDLTRRHSTTSLVTPSPIHHFATTDDGGLITAHHDHAVRLWDQRSLECVETLSGIHSGPVVWLTLDPNSPYCLLTCSTDGTCKQIDMRVMRILRTHTDHEDPLMIDVGMKPALHPRGRYLALAAENGVRLWDLEQGRCVVLSDTRGFSTLTNISWPTEDFMITTDQDGHVLMFSEDS